MKKRVILGLSGGVDSSVVCALLSKAIGKNLTAIFVNHGLLRLNEEQEVINNFKNFDFFDRKAHKAFFLSNFVFIFVFR